MVQLIQDASRLGYRVALVSDQAMPPLRGVAAEWHLALPVGSALTFDAHPAVLVALGLLLDAMCDVDPTAAESRLETFDAAAESCGIYWSGG
jgi:DNA-binding MurR/RpiR family transcriptional regulator